MSLTSTYRPARYAQVCGQETAVAALKGLAKQKDLPNAILLHGPSGQGKTTLARIFARAVNCETGQGFPCGKCESCKTKNHPDIEENNAANTRGIDEIRALINNAGFQPSFKRRVVILDEAHQLTPQAAQAFLKPLEEPPGACIYVLCTTDPEKFPKALLGRCTKIKLDAPTREQLNAHITKIAAALGKKLPASAINAIVDVSQCGVREAVNLLDVSLAVFTKNMTEEQLVQSIRNVTSEAEASSESLVVAMVKGDRAGIIRAIYSCDALPLLNAAIYRAEGILSKSLKIDNKVYMPYAAYSELREVQKQSHFTERLVNVIKSLVSARGALHTITVRETALLISFLAV